MSFTGRWTGRNQRKLQSIDGRFSAFLEESYKRKFYLHFKTPFCQDVSKAFGYGRYALPLIKH